MKEWVEHLYKNTESKRTITSIRYMTFVHKTGTDAKLMDCTSKQLQRVHLLVLIALLAHLAQGADGMASSSSCCTRVYGSCKLYEILCRAGRRNDSSIPRHLLSLNNDAALGILTLGKRKVGERRVQDRLQQLLHGSRNQAAGILTMGKRFEENAQLPLSAPVREVERPLKYPMPTVPDVDNYEKR